MHMSDMPKRKNIEKHQITAVIINYFGLFRNKMISVNVSRTKTDAFIATVLRCSR